MFVEAKSIDCYITHVVVDVAIYMEGVGSQLIAVSDKCFCHRLLSGGSH